MKYFGLIYPTADRSRLPRRGLPLRSIGPTFPTQREALAALAPELDYALERGWPVSGHLVEVDRQGLVVDILDVVPAREDNPGKAKARSPVAERWAARAWDELPADIEREEGVAAMLAASRLPRRAISGLMPEPTPAERAERARRKTERDALRQRAKDAIKDGRTREVRQQAQQAAEDLASAKKGLRAATKSMNPWWTRVLTERVAEYTPRVAELKALVAQLDRLEPCPEAAPAPCPDERPGTGWCRPDAASAVSIRIGEVDAIAGSPADVLYPSGSGGIERLSARYCLVPAHGVITSHDPWTFVESPAFDQSLQERDYFRDKGEQAKVERQTSRFTPELVLNTNPDAINGPPIVDPSGRVLGGNSRAMTIRRIMADRPHAYELALREALDRHCEAFGLAGVTDLTGMVLVRLVEGAEQIRTISSILNQALTQQIGEAAGAVAIGRQIPDAVLEELGDALADGKTLSQAIDAREGAIVRELQAAGTITPRNAAQWLVQRSGRVMLELSSSGRDNLARGLVGSLVADKDVLAITPASLVSLYERIAPVLLALDRWDPADRHGYNFLRHLRPAMREVVSVATLDEPSFRAWYANGSMFEDRVPQVDDPNVAVWVRWLWQARARPAQAARDVLAYWRAIPSEVRDTGRQSLFARSPEDLERDGVTPLPLRLRLLGIDRLPSGSGRRWLGGLPEERQPNPRRRRASSRSRP